MPSSTLHFTVHSCQHVLQSFFGQLTEFLEQTAGWFP